jgi:hypothetical protein
MSGEKELTWTKSLDMSERRVSLLIFSRVGEDVMCAKSCAE